ncbi:MAG: PKD domain-containing protein, partial [Lentimicrobiaceae bacterium]|nr:PKD domain-containing protein [Lentimicrobiaceae bacterium]
MKKSCLTVVFLLAVLYGRGQSASFVYSQPNKCAPSTVTFTNTSTVGYTAVNWNWGDPYDPNPDYQGMEIPTTHPFTQPGMYVVTLTVVYPSGAVSCKDTIYVYALPNFSFQKLNDSICPNGSISFAASLVYPAAPSGVSSYAWNFGDGQSSSVSSPTHVYANYANVNTYYTISLTITDTNGCATKVDAVNYVYVKSKPLADFDADSVLCFASAADSVGINFTNQSTGAVSYRWDFGDGNTSTQPSPSHIYAYSSSSYMVSLVATNAEGCTDTIKKTVRPLEYKVSYTISDTTLCNVPNSKVTLRGTDFGSEYLWFWGDGTSDYTSLSPIDHIYATQGNYAVRIEATHPLGCVAVDSVVIHAYSRHNPVLDGRYPLRERILSHSVCDPTTPITFINTTSYDLFDDFGYGSITWIFENDTIITTGDTVTYLFPDFGIHCYTAIITTPYGCVLDSVWEDSVITDMGWTWIEDLKWTNNNWVWDNWSFDEGGWEWENSWYLPYSYHVLISDCIEIFRTEFCGGARGEGCIPVTATFEGGCRGPGLPLVPFIRSASPITEVIIYWDFYGDKTDTTHLPLSSPLESIIWEETLSHIYPDTGVFEIVVIATNAEGCVDTGYFGRAMAGIPLTGAIRFDYKEQCRNEFFVDGTRFYVTFEVEGDTIDLDYYYLIDYFGDTSWYGPGNESIIVSPKDTGYWSIGIVPLWHNCPGTTAWADSIFYTCPPVAYFDFENVDSLNPFTWFDAEEFVPKFCNFPATLGFRENGTGVQWSEWWFGDAPLLSGQSKDTGAVTSFTYLGTDTFVWNNAGGIPGIVVNFAAHNADSVDIYSPTYNRCGYCADTTRRVFYISDAKMNFVADKYNICQNDTIAFCDSSITNTKSFKSWTFWVDSAANMDSAFWDYNIGEMIILPRPDSILSYDPDIAGSTGSFGTKLLRFTKPNEYRFVLENMCQLYCVRHDTLSVTVNPRSVAKYVSGVNSGGFDSFGNILCLNNPDTLRLRDSSYTEYPFDTLNITQWQWVVFGDTFRMQNPDITAKQRYSGLYPIELSITNERNCKTTIIDSSVLVKEAYSQFQVQDKYYCNGSTVSFTNRAGIYPLLSFQGNGITCIWDWGDGTPPEIQTIISNQYPYPTMQHKYDLPKSASGIVVVTLTAKVDGMNCESVFQDTLFIGLLNAGFMSDGNYFPCPGSIGRTVNFSDTSRGNAIYYYWDFGDTASGASNKVEGPNARNPNHQYLKPGSYDVSLIVTDDIGCWDTVVKEEFIFIDGPMGDFSYSPLSGCVDLEVIFVPEVEDADTVIVNPNLSIELKQGGTYVDSTISYTYTAAGAYLPYFYIIKWTDNNGVRCVYEWQGKDTIFVIDATPDFNTDSLYCINTEVSFQNQSVILPNSLLLDSIHWDFGNGETAVSPTASTSYDSSGVYDVTLTIYAKNCSKTVTYPINVMSFPDLQFYPDSASSCSNLEVVFTMDTLTDLENSRITGYDWTFSDGETYTGNAIRRPFTQTGWYTYSVLLTFTPENCVNQYEDSIYAEVFIVPAADFEPTPATVRMGESIHFIDKSQQGSGNIISWQWNLGEDTYSQEQSPTQTYQRTSGYVTVYLVITDTNGCMDSTEQQVLILENLRFPNIFTPQSLRPDGKPYVFCPLGKDGFFKEFKVEVYNRHGMLIWSQSCKEPNCPDYQDEAFWWNGKTQTGKFVSDGVYYWVVYAIPLS